MQGFPAGSAETAHSPCESSLHAVTDRSSERTAGQLVRTCDQSARNRRWIRHDMRTRGHRGRRGGQL